MRLGLLALLVSGAALASGRIAGTVGYTGKKPALTRINRTDPLCKAELTEGAVVVGQGGKALANVVVRLTRNAPTGSAVPAAPVTFTQQDCQFVPRVQGAMKGQKIVLKNADGTMHNVHAWQGLDEQRTVFNVDQPPGARDVERELRVPDVVKLKCDLHPWMRALVVMSEHPFFAVSDADGRFELPALPAGSYTVTAWHETLGTRSAEVTVEEGQAVDPKFSFP